MNNPFTYDCIIAGAGCAGLSLAVKLKEILPPQAKVLIVEQTKHKGNDRTWCFWSKEEHPWYEKAIKKQWSSFVVKNRQEEASYSLAPYRYNLIRSQDFYSLCLSILKTDSRFEWLYETMISVQTMDSIAVLKTSGGEYRAGMLFNSAIRSLSLRSNQVNFIQHFKGWMIRAETPIIDEERPVFMDFSVDQKNDCRFVYVIPFSKTEALVEYTGFSEHAWSDEEYDETLRDYVSQYLKGAPYTITETEKGQIPMTEGVFENPFGDKVINIGTAGGSSKPSTGYTFYFIQKHIAELIQQLQTKSNPRYGIRKARFQWYDSVLLKVLKHKLVASDSLFVKLFRQNATIDLLDFLNEESSISQELRIMNSVDRGKFIAAMFR